MAKKKAGAKFRFVDHPEITETFVDFVRVITFDGQTMRIELTATRMDDPKPPNPPGRARHLACRLVKTPEAVSQLNN